MANPIVEPRYASDWLKAESHNKDYSRHQGVMVAGAGKVLTGTVVGKVTATGKFKPVTIGASDGSQNTAGILLDSVDATTGDAPCVLIVREAIVMMQGLLYGADVTTPTHRATVQNALRALNPPILPREGA